jgi:homoserine O-acetyltransferase
MKLRAAAAALLCLAVTPALAQTQWPNEKEDNYILRNFRFASGETTPELRIHYTTLGTPKKNAAGEIVNGVILLHGTSGSSRNWLLPSLADELFKKGQPLDLNEYYVILMDAIGVGGSSKPSDGLKGAFPHYRYHDIVTAEHQLITEHLGIKHLRLVMGSSMGGMQTWMWGYMYPDLMDGLVPLASQPIGISGRNWINRRIRIEAIKNDPGYKNGFYETPPKQWIITAPMGPIGTEADYQIQQLAPTRDAADAFYKKLVEEASKADANNSLYGTESVMDYNPAPHLGKIKAKLLAINSADDEANPPSLHVMEPAIAKIPGAKYVLIPQTNETHGHYTHLRAALWKEHLVAFLKDLPPRK